MNSIKQFAMAILIGVNAISCGEAEPRGQGEGNGIDTAGAVGRVASDEVGTYACPMHPEVTGNAGDTCSTCGMALEKKD